MAEIPKDLLAKAYEAVKSEEREKAFLKDRPKDAPSLTPSDEFIDQSLGKSRDPKEVAEAVVDRARAYQRNAAPAPDYVEFPTREDKNRAQDLLEGIKARGKRSRSHDHEKTRS